MLGQKIMDSKGAMTGRRMLPSDGPRPKMEVTFESSGSVFGVPTQMSVTYWSMVRADGTLYGECPSQGLVVTQSGDSATFRGAGAGRFTGTDGGASFRGALYFETVSESLSRLNGLAVVYEWDVDGQGNATFTGWEWT